MRNGRRTNDQDEPKPRARVRLPNGEEREVVFVEPESNEPEEEREPILRDLISMALVIIGTILLSIAGGLFWGVGGVFAACGVMVVIGGLAVGRT